MFGVPFGSIDAYKFDGTKIKEFSEKIHRSNGGAVTFDDIDKDGKLEMVASSIDVGAYGGDKLDRASIYIWDTDTKYSSQVNEWNTFRHDNQRTGCYLVQDKTPPTGGIKINNSAEYVHSRTVILTMSAEDDISGVDKMQFSYDNVIWTQPETYAQTKSWTLSSGDGKKTVYVKFKDSAGNWSEPVSAGIILDTIPPCITQSAIISGSGITFTAKVIDAGSGVQDVFLHWQKKVLKWRGWKVKWVWSEWRKERLTLQPDKSYAVILTAKQVEHRDIKYYIAAADKLRNTAGTPQYQVKR